MVVQDGKNGREGAGSRRQGKAVKEVVCGGTAVLQGRGGETWLPRAEQVQQRRQFQRTQRERKRTRRYQRASRALAPLLPPLPCVGVRTRDYMLVRWRECVSAQSVKSDWACVCVYQTEVAPSLQGCICAEDKCCIETARCEGGLEDRVLTAPRLLNDGKRYAPPFVSDGNTDPKSGPPAYSHPSEGPGCRVHSPL